MLRKITLYLLLIGIVIGLSVWMKQDELVESEKISGAYEALAFLGEIQTYPSGTLPSNAHFAAWEKAMWDAGSRINTRSAAPWESIGPHNRGGRTLALAFNPQNPNTMYAGSASGGLWRTYTAGVGASAWHRVETGFPVLGVSCIAPVPGDSMKIFIGTGEVYNYAGAGVGAAYRHFRGSYGIGVLKTNDGGLTWEKSLDFSYAQQKGVWDIEINPLNPNQVFAAATDGVYKSNDGGNTWNLVLNVVMANDLVINPDDPNMILVGCGNFQSPGYGIYRTVNGGSNWQKIASNLPTNFKGKIQLGYAPTDPEIVYASIGNGFSSSEGASWLCRSEDFGLTWQIKSTVDYSKWQGWFSHDVAVSPANSEEIVVIGIEAWKSTNGGSTLVQKSLGGIGFSNPPIEGPDGAPNFIHSDIHDVIYHPAAANIVYYASDGGIHRSLNGGDTFTSCNGAYQTAQFYNGFSNSAQNETFCMGGLQDNGTIRWNGDLTWTLIGGGDGSWTAINQQDDNIFYRSSQYLNVTRSLNGLTNGMNIPSNNALFIAPYAVAPGQGNFVYAGSARLAKSTDAGSTWFSTTPTLPFNGNSALSIAVSHQNPNVVYIGTAPTQNNRGGVFISTNGGISIRDITQDLPDRYPMDLEVDPTDHAVAYVAFSGFGTGHVFRTSDFGLTWEDISNGLPDVPSNAVAVDPMYPNNIYVGNDLGVFSSVDYGATWQAYLDGLPEAVMVFDLKISPANRKLRAATHGNGAFQRELLEEPYVTSTNDLQTGRIALTISPNPVRDLASFGFYMQKPQQPRIDLVDNNGRKVKSIPLNIPATGNNLVELDLSELPAGIYFAKISNGLSAGVAKFIKASK